MSELMERQRLTGDFTAENTNYFLNRTPEYDVIKNLYRDGDDILGKERAARYLEVTAKQDIRLKTGRYREMLNSLFNYIQSNY